MTKNRLIEQLSAMGLLALLMGALPAFADTRLEDLNVMALGPVDGRAVVKTADGKMQVLKIGDTLPGTKAVVTQVLTDKLVVEETIEKKDEPPVKQTVWIYKAAKAGEKSQVQRLDRQGPPKAAVEKPVLNKVLENKK
jgi:hypothetical protein